MNTYPRISIVTPSYNKARYLENTIKSVLTQEYPNLEYIIIDGGSTDNSVEIIRKYADRLAYWVTEPDQGQSDALNKGFRMATGDIVAELCADDLFLPGTLHIVAEYFKIHPNVDFLYGDIHIIDGQSKLLYQRKTIPFNYKMQLYGGCLIPEPSSFFRKSVFAKVGYFDTTLPYSMDLDFFIRCAQKGIRFDHIPQPLACFRLYSAQKTHHSDNFNRSVRTVTSKYAERIFHNDWMNDAALRLLRWFYRAKISAIRAITRGDMIPYKGTIARAREKHKSVS